MPDTNDTSGKPPEKRKLTPEEHAILKELALSRKGHTDYRNTETRLRYCAAREAAAAVGLYDPALEH